MSAEFDRKARVVADAWEKLAHVAEAQDFINENNLGFPAAFFHIADMAILKEEGRYIVEQTYDNIISSLLIDDGPYQNYTEVSEAHFADQAKWKESQWTS